MNVNIALFMIVVATGMHANPILASALSMPAERFIGTPFENKGPFNTTPYELEPAPELTYQAASASDRELRQRSLLWMDMNERVEGAWELSSKGRIPIRAPVPAAWVFENGLAGRPYDRSLFVGIRDLVWNKATDNLAFDLKKLNSRLFNTLFIRFKQLVPRDIYNPSGALLRIYSKRTQQTFIQLRNSVRNGLEVSWGGPWQRIDHAVGKDWTNVILSIAPEKNHLIYSNGSFIKTFKTLISPEKYYDFMEIIGHDGLFIDEIAFLDHKYTDKKQYEDLISASQAIYPMRRGKRVHESARNMTFNGLSGTGVYYVDKNADHASDTGPGSFERPWKTLTESFAKLKAGDTLIIRAGIYRTLSDSGGSSSSFAVFANGTRDEPIQIIGAPGEDVILTQARVQQDWEYVDALKAWRTKIRVYHPPHGMTFYGYTWIRPGTMVFADGEPLRPVESKDQLAPGKFWYDGYEEIDYGQERSLYIRLIGDESPQDYVIEMAYDVEAGGHWRHDKSIVIALAGKYIELKNVTVRYNNGRGAYNRGAVFLGSYCKLEDSIVEWTGLGVLMQPSSTVNRCIIRNNSQMGLTGGIGYPDNQPDNQADRWGVFHSKVSHNAHWSKWSSGVWFAGGSKFTQSFGMTVEDNYFAYNFGHGIWFDVGNHGAKIINNHCEYNSHNGIFYEISFDGLIKDNRVNHNGVAHGRDGGAGILVYSSPHTAVINNISIKNKTGIAFHHEPRTTSIWEPKKQKHWLPWPQGQDLAGWTPWPTVNGLTARGLRIENNVLSHNRKADIANFTNNCQFLRDHTANMVIRNNRYSTAGLKIVWGAKNTPCGQKVITSLAEWEKQYGFGQNSTLLDNAGGH